MTVDERNGKREGEELYGRVAEIIESARKQVARTVNTAMVHAYWNIGREIVEVEQRGRQRADYGDELMHGLARRLTARYGRGFSYSSVKRMRQFFLTFPAGSAIGRRGARGKGSTLWSLFAGTDKTPESLNSSDGPAPVPFPPALSWSHYRALLRVGNEHARAFYEIEAARESWSVRELERQIDSLLYERLSSSRDRDQLVALARRGQTISRPEDVIKDPFVLEFVGLDGRSAWREQDLEAALIARLETFLLELGKGFCFVGRQKRITLDGDHFYTDLVFYNRLLRCFVLIDLKLGKLTHHDLGQMQMYVNYYDRYLREDYEAPTVGILLCSEKNDAMVKITLPPDNAQIHASRYKLYLPTEEELRTELEREREAAERALRLRGEEPDRAEENPSRWRSGYDVLLGPTRSQRETCGYENP